jgi:DGQHR domain-containing protein
MEATVFKAPCIAVKQAKRSFILTKMPASVLSTISYASVRRRDQEDGAIQRLLDSSRIKEVKEFALVGGDFPSSIILNWVSTENPLTINGDEVSFTVGERLAQLLDGQHRVEGLRAAVKESTDFAKNELPVAIYTGLTTPQCADIFISINDKQVRVKKSMVVDLYNVASDYVVDIVAQRARDLADMLDSEDGSPYSGYIKYATSPPSAVGIPLSTVVNNIKPLVESDGVFETVGLVELNMQKACIFNFFTVLKNWYGRKWSVSKENVFLTAAGFTGAIDFLKLTMIPQCNLTHDFTGQNMAQVLNLNPDELIDRESLKGLQGRAAWNKVVQLLKQRIRPSSSSQEVKV